MFCLENIRIYHILVQLYRKKQLKKLGVFISYLRYRIKMLFSNFVFLSDKIKIIIIINIFPKSNKCKTLRIS